MLDPIAMQHYQLVGLFRLFLAAVLGGIMGMERTRRRREAGFRTYILVSLGSAMTVMVGEMMLFNYGSADTTRIAASAVSGIGFIGAGSILVSRSNRVMGITTAAGLWVSVSVGMAVACGYYSGAVAMVVISEISTTLGKKVEQRFLHHGSMMRLVILFRGEENVLPFLDEIQMAGYTINSLDMEKPITDCVSATLLLQVPHHRDHGEVLEELRVLPGVVFAETI
jgi:putative Mg2+ transporter-C (MgtC) family protein